MSVKITAVAKALPKYNRPTSEIIPFLELWLSNQDKRYQRKVIKIFENAGVEKRYGIMSPEEVFTKTSFEEKNEIYKREVTNLAENALNGALEKANIRAKDIDYIITVKIGRAHV